MVEERDRILGCLKGLATGDAVGKQAEGLSRGDVARWYPKGIRGFEGQPGAVIPRYVGSRKRKWLFGETTDDTERTIAVARAILRDGTVRHTSVGREMLKCTKSIHPGVQSLWEFHRAGDPARVTDDHDGCGAAIRVAPVGILYRSRCLDEIVAGAREASISTHGGTFALAASAATAAAVSAAIDGAGADEILDLAELAADRAEAARSGSMETAFSLAIRMIVADLRRAPTLNAAEIANRYFPSTPLAIVPVAIALATVVDSAQSAILLAANIGGDADSVASIAGAICGARYPESVNDDWYRVVETVNNHRLADLGDALARVRSLRKP